ncbi:hypothetical protein [Wenzhouxiangella limi]|uniref:hypothetical protein n=1 Tax=Wenzhouxiangella limi TaxID=2707351 RepID=UPI001944CAA8|nr:hypothetical protein [Wenzhouxiangella limi]
MLRNLFSLYAIALIALAFVSPALADTPETKNGLTRVHLDQDSRCLINPTPWYEVGVSG